VILGDKTKELDRAAAGDRTTLDDLFRRAGVRHPDMVALADPPNRASFTDGPPRKLTYAQTDRAISALAGRLRRLGLQTDMVVALQLPNTVESVIALLAVLRAGMIAVPLPLLWREQETVAALRMTGAKAIVTTSRIGSTPHAEIAMQVAADVFPIRFVCSFGNDVPDGVLPLDDIFGPADSDFVQPSVRPGNAAEHIALVTFDIGTDSIRAVARNHSELIAGGHAPHLESGAPQDSAHLSTIPLGSFAGLALTLMPWLLGGGTLNLHHGFDPDTFAAQCRIQTNGTVVLPGPVLASLAQTDRLGTPSAIIALWRSPDRLARDVPWRGEAKLVDVASFGEAGLLAGLRGDDGQPLPIAYGGIGAPREAADAVNVIEVLRTAGGTLALRGPMVPVQAFPPGAERGSEPQLAADKLGFVDSEFACHLEPDSQTLVIDSPTAGITSVGGYRFRQNQIEWLVAEADLDAVIVAVPNAYLGARLGGSAPDYPAIAAQLRAVGANPLIVEAFRSRAIPA
jgi:non-ribosomal peptide synthetase component E (peptide arylation enzyme)